MCSTQFVFCHNTTISIWIKKFSFSVLVRYLSYVQSSSYVLYFCRCKSVCVYNVNEDEKKKLKKIQYQWDVCVCVTISDYLEKQHFYLSFFFHFPTFAHTRIVMQQVAKFDHSTQIKFLIYVRFCKQQQKEEKNHTLDTDMQFLHFCIVYMGLI